MHRAWRVALQLFVAISLGSCSSEVSQIIVIVDAEPGARDVTRFVRVQVYGGARRDQVSTMAVAELDSPLRSEPIAEPNTFWGRTRIALAPVGYDSSRIYRVEVSAYAGGDERTSLVASTYVISGYVRGETRVLRLLLLDACIGVVCPPEQVCGTDASCRDPFVPPERLAPDCVDGECVGGMDVGPLEAGTSDAGMDAGAEAGMDAGADGGTDAGVDGGTDAGTDGGTDASTDAGTDGGMDAGTDSGMDAGRDAGTDAGMGDVGTCFDCAFGCEGASCGGGVVGYTCMESACCMETDAETICLS